MKPARLVVRNFGPLKDIDIKVTDFLCLIGKQATGKSTIAKLIAIFEDENFREDFFIQNLKTYGLYACLNKDSYISYKVEENNQNSFLHFDFIYQNKKIVLKNFKTYFVHLFENKKVKNMDDAQKVLSVIQEIVELLIEDTKSFDDVLTANKVKGIFLSFENEVAEHTKILKDILSVRKETDIKKFNETKNKLDNLVKVLGETTERCYVKIVEFLKLDSQYIPSERNFLHIIAENTLGLINNDVQIPKHLLEIGQEYEKALNVVKEIPLSLINKKFSYKREGKTSYIYHDSESKIDLLQSASGLQSILPIMLLIEYAKTLKDNYHFNYVVEEPELNIYPETQHNLIKYLVSSIFNFNEKKFQRKKLVITTHSPYILASINNLLLAFVKGQEKPIETQKIIKRQSWINPKSFNAYELKNGKSFRIMNDNLGQIKSNIIDSVTDKFSDEFDKILSL